MIILYLILVRFDINTSLLVMSSLLVVVFLIIKLAAFLKSCATKHEEEKNSKKCYGDIRARHTVLEVKSSVIVSVYIVLQSFQLYLFRVDLLVMLHPSVLFHPHIH